MKKINTVARWKNIFNYEINMIEENDISHVIIRNKDKHPYGIISVIDYPSNIKSVSSPLLNWENLIRCSNYYGISPEEIDENNQPGYMSLAVQKHLKPAATLRYNIDNPFIRNLEVSLPDDCLILKYKEENTTFICRNCSLADLFNIDEVNKTYERYGIQGVEWDKVKALCKKELSYFSDNLLSGISIESGTKNLTQDVIVGLLLGYPIESTVAKIKKTYRTDSFRFQAVKHFKDHLEPYIDADGEKWLKDGNTVFASWQKESKYF